MTETISVELELERDEAHALLGCIAAALLGCSSPAATQEFLRPVEEQVRDKLQTALSSPQPSNEARYEEALQQITTGHGTGATSKENWDICREIARRALHPDTQEVEGA